MAPTVLTKIYVQNGKVQFDSVESNGTRMYSGVDSAVFMQLLNGATIQLSEDMSQVLRANIQQTK